MLDMIGRRRLGFAGPAVMAGAALLAGCSAGTPAPAPPAATLSSAAVAPTTSAGATQPGSTATPSGSSSSGSSSSGSSGSTAATPTASGGGGGTSGGGGGGGTGGGGTGGGRVSACASKNLRADAGSVLAAAGSVYQSIVFTNLGSTPCTLSGYPGVALAAGTPVTQVGAAADRSSTSVAKVVTLAAGGQASAVLRITQAENYPADKCHPQATTYLQVYPPSQTTPLYLPYKSTGCGLTSVHLLTIQVVQPGNGG